MIPQIEYKLITPSIGAEIIRFDCTSVTSEIATELRKLLISRKVLVFRDQAITPSEFLKFMKNFGNPYAEDIKPQDGNPPEIGVIKIQPA
ncbi:MAG: TauD/TfdA family dioxygenase, partial [Alphaproteobacteria bacterium]|nr:TauD/TfdA family dioxygenase [Alphaproteobacteria bacterium]